MGVLVPLRFRIDTGADFSAMPLSVARNEGIAHQATQKTLVAGLVGATGKYRDRIRVIIAKREHDWPCEFVDVPNPARERTPDHLLNFGVLGRAGFLDDYAFTIDGEYFILWRVGPLQRWIRKLVHRVWEVLGMVYNLQKPV